jgi:spore coat protein CotF
MVAQDELRMFKHAISLIEQEIHKRQLTLAEYDKLQNTGFALRELILWNNIIRQIATSNNIDSSIAVKKFFQD